METLTPPEAGHERISFGKTGVSVGALLATTLWVVLSICLIPVLGIGIFLLPMTHAIAKQVKQRAQRARHGEGEAVGFPDCNQPVIVGENQAEPALPVEPFFDNRSKN